MPFLWEVMALQKQRAAFGQRRALDTKHEASPYLKFTSLANNLKKGGMKNEQSNHPTFSIFYPTFSSNCYKQIVYKYHGTVWIYSSDD